MTEIKRKDSICMKNIVQCKIYPGVCLFLQLSALNASGIFEGLVTIKAAHHCQLFFIIYLYREYVSSRSFSTQLMGSFVLAVGLWLRFDPETVSLLSGDKAPDTFFIGEHLRSSLQPSLALYNCVTIRPTTSSTMLLI